MTGIHDLHVWELVDSMIIASVHVSVLETEVAHFDAVVSRCKKVMHRAGIHSSTIQPEFISKVSETV